MSKDFSTCTMGVGCNEAGKCFAEAQGKPDMCALPVCTCCDKPEPEAGWFAIGGGGPVESWEFYCSKPCFNNHTDGTCGCFQDESLFDEPDDDITF